MTVKHTARHRHDDDLTIPAAIKVLASHQKSKKGAPAYSRYVNRPLGRVFAAIAYRWNLTPDRVTFASGLTSLSGIIVLAAAPPSLPVGIAVSLLLVLGYALDSADGQLARLSGGGSPAGEWLDHVVDCIKVNLLHLTVLLSLYRHTDLDHRLLLLPVAYVLVANLYFFSFILGDLLKRLHGQNAPAPERKPSALRSLLVAPTDYGVMCLVFMLWGTPTTFLWAYGIMMLGTAGYTALGLPKWRRDMAALQGVS